MEGRQESRVATKGWWHRIVDQVREEFERREAEERRARTRGSRVVKRVGPKADAKQRGVAEAQQPVARFVSPPLPVLQQRGSMLNDSERLVLSWLDKCLPPETEIYCEPDFMGVRPDFVLLDKKRGVTVLEVKHWELSKYQLRGTPPTIHYRGHGGAWQPGRCPLEQLETYRKHALALLADAPVATGHGRARVNAALVITKTTTAGAREFFNTRAFPELREEGRLVVGNDGLSSLDATHLFPTSRPLSSEEYHLMRSWLMEAAHQREYRSHLQLAPRIDELVESAGFVGRQRVDGSAGSGKTVLLACRAAELAARGESVLVVANSETGHKRMKKIAQRYLRDIASQRFVELAGIQSREETLRNVVFVDSLKTCDEQHSGRRFSGVYIDEADHLVEDELATLKRLSAGAKELLLAVDRSRNGGPTVLTPQAFHRLRLHQPWVELRENHRLPAALLPLLARNARVAGSSQDASSSTGGSRVQTMGAGWGRVRDEDLPFALRWQNVTPAELNAVVVQEVRNAECHLQQLQERYTRERGLERRFAPFTYSDVTIALPSSERGVHVVSELLAATTWRTRHTFAKAPSDTLAGRQDSAKRADDLGRSFRLDAPGIKAATWSQLRGWESRVLIVVIDAQVESAQLGELLTLLRSVKRDESGAMLSVISCHRAFDQLSQHLKDA